MRPLIHKIKQFIKWTFIYSVLLVIAFLVIVTLFFPVNRVVRYVTDTVGNSIGRKIVVQEASFNVFKGVLLKGVEISNDKRYSRKPMFSVQELWLAYDWRSLVFKRRVNITSVELTKPEFLYEKDKRGDNVVSILQFKDKGKDKDKKINNEKVKSEPIKRQPIDIQIQKVLVRNGSFMYSDSTARKKKTMEIEGLTLAIRDITSHLQNQPLTARGNLRFVAGSASSRIAFSVKAQGPKRFTVSLALDKVNVDKYLTAFSAGKAKVTKKKDTKNAKPLTTSAFIGLAGYDVDCTGTVSQVTWRRIDVTALKFNVQLHAQQFVLSTSTQLYDGTVRAIGAVDLRKKGLPFEVKAEVKRVNGEKFLGDALLIERAVSGYLTADALVRGLLSAPARISGTVSTTFENGTLINSKKILPDIPDYICEQLNGKGFDLFFFKLMFKNGKATVGALKAKGEGLDIDQTVDLDMDKLKRQVQNDINKEKKRINKEAQQAIDKKKAEMQEQLDGEKQKAADSMQKEIENKLRSPGTED